jgi:di/tricarboxylate transporter
VLVIGGCRDAGSALRAIRWDIYLLLGGLYSLSVALQQSGLAALVANRLLATIYTWPAYTALGAVYGLTLITTELLSNAAAVALVLPIAANLAPGLQLAPMLLITTVVFAASQSFPSPIGYQTNLMVFAPGRYRFLDVLRYGWPLSLVYAVVVPALVLWLG